MKIQENLRDSKMLQEDDKSDARRPKDPLQEKNLQEDSMDESLNIELYATSWESLEDGHKKGFWEHQKKALEILIQP